MKKAKKKTLSPGNSSTISLRVILLIKKIFHLPSQVDSVTVSVKTTKTSKSTLPLPVKSGEVCIQSQHPFLDFKTKFKKSRSANDFLAPKDLIISAKNNVSIHLPLISSFSNSSPIFPFSSLFIGRKETCFIGKGDTQFE